MQRTVVYCCAALALALAGGLGSHAQDKGAKGVNLLLNGSFEEGSEPKSGDHRFKPLDEDATDIRGWIVTRGQIDYIGGHFKAADGERCIDLHGSPGFGGVKQTFTTREGQRYRVTLSLAGTPGVGQQKVGVRAAGKKTAFTSDGTNGTPDNPDWQTHTWEFTAIADHTSLEIHTLETTAHDTGPLLDKVSVVATEK